MRTTLAVISCLWVGISACRVFSPGMSPTQTPGDGVLPEGTLQSVISAATSTQALTNGQTSYYPPLENVTFETAIVPQSLASDFIYALEGEEVTETWTPTEADILLLEKRIKAYTQTELEKDRLNPLSGYQRQYAGGIVKGHKLLYANFFCQTFDTDWHTTPIVVMDGGNCFFQVIYDLQTDDFVIFSINGEA